MPRKWEACTCIWVCSAPRGWQPIPEWQYTLPARFMYMVRPMRDYILLPGGHPPTLEFAKFCMSIFGIEPWQVIYTSGQNFCLLDDMDYTTTAAITNIIRAAPGNGKVLFIPYSSTPEFFEWATRFQSSGPIDICGEAPHWVEKLGHKGILHRHMATPEIPSVLETIDPTIPIAPGFVCSTNQHLLDAYAALGVADVVIKPLGTCAGLGIEFLSSPADLRAYAFPHGEVVLEVKLDLDLAPGGSAVSPAVHYMGQELLPPDLVEQIMAGTTYVGWNECHSSEPYRHKALEITRKLIEHIQPEGPGGFDFLSVRGEPVLSDVNTARFNGAHQYKLFLESDANIWSEDADGAAFYSPNHRPDIVVLDFEGGGRHLLIDVSVARPLALSHVAGASLTAGYTADRAERAKLLAYGNVGHHRVVPFVLEEFGAMGPLTSAFFKECCRLREDRLDLEGQRAPWSARTWTSYWRQRLSVALTRAMADIMLRRTRADFAVQQGY
eukprot:jgi/Mesvir1/25746/Mv01927-RA.1